MNKIQQSIIDFYLDWVNNFISVERMAEYYGISKMTIVELIHEGRKLHEFNVKRLNKTL